MQPLRIYLFETESLPAVFACGYSLGLAKGPGAPVDCRVVLACELQAWIFFCSCLVSCLGQALYLGQGWPETGCDLQGLDLY